MLKIGFTALFLSTFILLQQSADEVLNKVQEKFDSIENFSADFIESNSGIKGDFFFKKENQFKVKTKRRTIVSDGKTIWNYDQKINRVVINNIENEPSGFSIRQYLFDYPEKCDKRIVESNASEKILEFIPKDDELGFESAKIFVDKNYLVKRIKLKNEVSGGVDFQFDNIQLNINLSKETFEFNSPQGSTTIDLR